jgi:hypothetical protein
MRKISFFLLIIFTTLSLHAFDCVKNLADNIKDLEEYTHTHYKELSKDQLTTISNIIEQAHKIIVYGDTDDETVQTILHDIRYLIKKSHNIELIRVLRQVHLSLWLCMLGD